MLTNSQLTRRLPRLILAGLVCGLLVAGFTLATSLPWNQNAGRYWDDAALYQGIQNDGFPSGRGVITGEYAILKFGYALPFWYMHRWLGVDAALTIGLFWFAVMLLSPAVAGYFRRASGIDWAAWLTWSTALVALPIVNKYIGMSNPTIQSMAHWLLLVLFYGQRRQDRVGWMLAPGILCGLIVLTDYKWLVFVLLCIPAIELTESAAQRGGFGDAFKSDWRRILRRSAAVYMWMLAVLGIAATLNSAYLRSVIYYATGPERINALRPSLSANFPIFLWVLGGFWIVAWTLSQPWLRRNPEHSHEESVRAMSRRAHVVIGVIVLLFSLLIWPRSARMFAPAVVLLLLLFAVRVSSALTAIAAGSRPAVINGVLLAAVVAGLMGRAVRAGDYYRAPSGVDSVVNFLMARFDDIPPQQIGCYLPPVFRIYLDRPYEWVFLPSVVPSALNWVITSDPLDRTVIDEQRLLGAKSAEWTAEAIHNRGRLVTEGKVVASFPNHFYASPYYLCESYYSNGELLDALRRSTREPNSTWDIRFVGSIFGREPPAFVPR